MRRGDFTYAHPKEIPSVKGAAEQVIAKTKELNLSKIFLATDAESHGRLFLFIILYPLPTSTSDAYVCTKLF